MPARVKVPDGLLMTSGGSAPAAVVAAPVKVWAPAPPIVRLAVPPAYAEAWLMFPVAMSVPGPLRVPAVSVVVPFTVRVVPAVMVLVPAVRVRLLNASTVETVTVADPPPNDTVPALALNEPPVTEKAPDTDWVAVVGAKVPPEMANGPFTVNAAVPPTNAPPAWVQPVAPTVAAMPAAWLICPP